MINETKTFKLFGYTSDSLSKRSNKKIIRVCDECGRENEVIFATYTRAKNPNRCITCSNKSRMNLSKSPIVLEQDRFIKGTGIDRIETIKLFGYDPVDLSKGSQYKVYSICTECGKGREIFNHPYHPLCNSCAKKGENNGMFGKPASDYQKMCISKVLTGITRTDIERQKVSATKQKIPYDEWVEYCSRDYVLPLSQCTKLNKKFEGSNAHHIMNSVVIFMPKDLHKSIYHNFKTGRGMKEINQLAWNWLTLRNL